MTFKYNRPGCWRGLIGAVVVFAIGGQAAAQSTQPALEEKLTAADAAAGDHFGASVAVSGVTAVVGAEAADVVGLDSGAAYVFRRAPGLNTSWGQVAKLVAADAGAGDLFGAAVAVSGGRVVVGAPLDGDAGALSGSAYVFERRPDGSDEWDQTAKLVAPDGAPGDEFGAAVAIDGDTIVIGSPFDSDDGFASGAVYVYRYVPIGIGTWRAVQKLTASDAANSDRFGTAGAVERSEILIGAEFDDDNGPDSGSAARKTPRPGHPPALGGCPRCSGCRRRGIRPTGHWRRPGPRPR